MPEAADEGWNDGDVAARKRHRSEAMKAAKWETQLNGPTQFKGGRVCILYERERERAQDLPGRVLIAAAMAKKESALRSKSVKLAAHEF
jgi:hypothetical protein